MSKICPVCGYNCEDAADFCPACGFTFSNPASASVDQTNPQPNPQPNTQQGVQNVTQQVPPNVMQQNFAQQAPPKKKKTLWIVLGIVGGVLILLFIIFIILFFVLRSYFSSMGIVEPPRTQGGSGISDLSIFNTRKDLQEYYYEDYDSASFNSEAFVDTTTEEPATVEEPTSTESIMTELDGSSEGTESSDNTTNSEASFRPEDLTLTVKEDDTVLNMEESFHYIFAADAELVTFGNDSLDVPPGFEGKQIVTGRGITIGSTFDELIATYGIGRNNAIWQLPRNPGYVFTTSGYDYYYYSTTTRPDSPKDTLLMFGWYRSGGDWQRMTPTELNDYWGNRIAPPCDDMLLYNISFDVDYNVSFGYIAYGSPEWCKEHVYYD